MQFRSRNINPVETCHYCNKSAITESGRWIRLGQYDPNLPKDKQEPKVWFCHDACGNMAKHELGLDIMPDWLYTEMLEKCYPDIYQMRFSGGTNQRRRREQQPQQPQQKKKQKDNKFQYKHTPPKKEEGIEKNTYETLS